MAENEVMIRLKRLIAAELMAAFSSTTMNCGFSPKEGYAIFKTLGDFMIHSLTNHDRSKRDDLKLEEFASNLFTKYMKEFDEKMNEKKENKNEQLKK